MFLNILENASYRKSGTQDPKLGAKNLNFKLGIYRGTLRQDPRVVPLGEI